MFVVRMSSLSVSAAAAAAADADATTLWTERQNPICYKLAIHLGVLKCLDENSSQSVMHI